MTILSASPNHVEPAPLGPQGWQDWCGLRAWADRLLGEAEASTAATDADRRILRAVAMLWRAMVEGTDTPDRLPASRAEIRALLDRRAAEAPRPGMASSLRTLAWWHQPHEGYADGTPRIVAVLSINAEIRRRRALRSANAAASANDNKGGRHVTRSAARAPSMQPAAERPRRSAATQPGLL